MDRVVFFLVFIHLNFLVNGKYQDEKCKIVKDDKNVVKIAAIIPADEGRLFSTNKVRSIFDYAIQEVAEMNILTGVNFSIKYADSKCNTVAAPIAAFDLYMRGAVDVFFGPVCDYSLAPVARYAPYWDIPVISPGGLAHDFGVNKSTHGAEYPLLTRVGATFDSLSHAMLDAFEFYNWNKVKVIYDGEGLQEITLRFCFLAASALINFIKIRELEFDLHLYVPKMHNIGDMLKEEMGNEYGGSNGPQTEKSYLVTAS